MPVVVVALPEDEYRQWVREQKGISLVTTGSVNREWTLSELMDKGEQVYAAQCATCHQPDGQGLPPAFPALAGSPVATGNIIDHLEVVLEGREGTAMQAYADMLTPSDIAAAITYTRNAFGNDTGDLVQPAAIADVTKG